MIKLIYLSVLFRAKSVKENIYKTLLTLSTCTRTPTHSHTVGEKHKQRSTFEMTIKHKQNSSQEQQ